MLSRPPVVALVFPSMAVGVDASAAICPATITLASTTNGTITRASDRARRRGRDRVTANIECPPKPHIEAPLARQIEIITIWHREPLVPNTASSFVLENS
ncbi:MAG: hypothetical protein ACLPVY_25175 [Acidimicrobiia bacterium]